MKLSHAVAATLLAMAAGQAMACYTVYDARNLIVYSDQTPPVDMTRPLHDTLPARYPGGHMVFDNGGNCPSQARPRVVSTNGKSPLLTESRTAQAMGLAHTELGNGIAVVRERPDSMRAGVMLAESGLPREGDTRAMGAGPAPQRQGQAAASPAPHVAQPQFVTPNGAPPAGITRSTR